MPQKNGYAKGERQHTGQEQGLPAMLQHPALQQMLSQVQPTRRGECRSGPRPCPHTICMYHLYFRKQGSEPSPCSQGKEVWQLQESCQLDLLEREHPIPPNTPLQPQHGGESAFFSSPHKTPPPPPKS